VEVWTNSAICHHEAAELPAQWTKSMSYTEYWYHRVSIKETTTLNSIVWWWKKKIWVSSQMLCIFPTVPWHWH